MIKENNTQAAAIEILITNLGEAATLTLVTISYSYSHFIYRQTKKKLSPVTIAARLTLRMSDAPIATTVCDFPSENQQQQNEGTHIMLQFASEESKKKNLYAFPNARRKLKQFTDSQ